MTEESANLVAIKRTDENFSIQQVDDNSNSQLWIVIRYLPGSFYEISEGDVFRLGRVLLKIKSFCGLAVLRQGSQCLPDTPSEKTCKICCSEENTDLNPLISPCKCAGSLQYIHYSCLKNWLQSKVLMQSLGTVSIYRFADFVCEICKNPLPEFFEHDGKMLSLVEIQYPTGPYIIIEEVKPDENQNQVLYVVGIGEGESITIGRETDSEIKLLDISVSRHHAKIRYSHNRFYIYDNKSKFGTLVSSFKNLPLTLSSELTIQTDRTLVTFTVKKPSMCCKQGKVIPRH